MMENTVGSTEYRGWLYGVGMSVLGLHAFIATTGIVCCQSWVGVVQ